MLDNLDGSNEQTGDPASVMYGEPEQEPTVDAEVVDSEVEEAEDVEPEADQGQSDEALEVDDSDDEAEVFDQPNDFAKYSFDEDSGLYEFKSMGKKVKVNIENLIKSFQADQKLTSELQTIANERKGLWDEAKNKEIESLRQQSQLYQQKLQEISGLTEGSGKTDEEWEELRETDISEYTRLRELDSKRKKALEEAAAMQVEEQQKRRKATIEAESQKLLTLMGDNWKDPEVREKEWGQMQEVMSAHGFTTDEMNSLLDARAWKIVWESMQYQKAQQKVSESKQAKKTPKKVKTSKTASEPPRSAAQVLYGSN